MEIIILKYISYNKGIENKEIHIKEIGKEVTIYNDLKFLDNVESIIISFDYDRIIDDLPSHNEIAFIDLENLKKQLVGRSKTEFTKYNKPWSIWNMIAKLDPTGFGLNNNEFEIYVNQAKIIFLGLNSNDIIDVSQVIKFMMNCLESIYLDLKTEISNSPELQRFCYVDVLLNNILFNTQKKGLNIDVEVVKNYIRTIDDELYRAKNKLQLEYGIFSLDDYHNIKKALIVDCLNIGDIKINSKEFWKILKLNPNKSNLINLLYSVRKLSRNKSILTRLGSLENSKIYPSYNYFGTITSRITLNNPSLQQLNKVYRNILVPDHGKQFLYIDYSQFEAGILAYASNDKNLIKMYNKNDIYNEVCKALDNTVSRDIAKKMFFYYCYGANRASILKFHGIDMNVFFKEFEGLKIFETELEEEFQRNNYIDTLLGNRRNKADKDDKAQKWIMSQRIQGSASLILKTAIINIYKENSEIEFILPMHDAVLYQVPIKNVEEYKIKIKRIFEESLKLYCPTLVNPKALYKPFFEVIIEN